MVHACLLCPCTPAADITQPPHKHAWPAAGIEFFGGQGYIESTHLPVILRDAQVGRQLHAACAAGDWRATCAVLPEEFRRRLCVAPLHAAAPQVLPIWEGATSVLALDVLRVLGGSPAAAATFVHQCSVRLGAALHAATSTGSGRATLHSTCLLLQQRLAAVSAQLQAAAAVGVGSEGVQAVARDLAFNMARLYIGGGQAQHAAVMLHLHRMAPALCLWPHPPRKLRPSCSAAGGACGLE